MAQQWRGRPESQARSGQSAPGSGSASSGGRQGGQSGTSSSGGSAARQASSPRPPEGQSAADPIGNMAEQLKEQGQETVGSLTGQLRQQAMTQARSQKDMAADSLNSVAMAIRQTSQTLKEQGQAPVAEYAEKGADQVERLSGYLRQHDLVDVVTEVEYFARRQPVAFLGAAFGVGFLASRFLKSSAPPPNMGTRPGLQTGMAEQSSSVQSFEHSIDIELPIQSVYGQWTQFEQFPEFMEGVEQVRQLDDKTLHWRAQIAGKPVEWDATIVEQVPDQRIAWRNVNGAHNLGRVTFQVVSPMTTRVTLWLEYQPEGVAQNVGSRLGLVQRRVWGDLNRFKQFVESRGAATGSWRGEIHDETVKNP